MAAADSLADLGATSKSLLTKAKPKVVSYLMQLKILLIDINYNNYGNMLVNTFLLIATQLAIVQPA